EREVGAHLVDALQRRGARLRDVAGIALRREVAEAQARIIVARPDDPVEIDFAQHHLATARTSSPIFTPSMRAASGSIAIPFLGTRRTDAQQARNFFSRPAATIILVLPPSSILSIWAVTVGPPSKMST